MSTFFDLLVVLALVVWLLQLVASGTLSPEFAAFAILVLVVLRAAGRALGLGLWRTVFTVGLPLTSLAVFVVVHGRGDAQAMTQIAASMLQLAVVPGAIYVMVRGAFGGWSRRRPRK